MGFATGKAHKRETQGKYFYLDFKKREFDDLLQLDEPKRIIRIVWVSLKIIEL